MRTALSSRVKKDIETTIRFARRLLDNYHPQDVRGETRAACGRGTLRAS